MRRGTHVPSSPFRPRRGPPQAGLQAGQGLPWPPQEHDHSANAAVDRSLQHNYIGRKEKKRNFRALWIQRINAACREHGLTYSRFISGLARAGIEIDRKVLSDLAVHEPAAFKALVDQARA